MNVSHVDEQRLCPYSTSVLWTNTTSVATIIAGKSGYAIADVLPPQRKRSKSAATIYRTNLNVVRAPQQHPVINHMNARNGTDSTLHSAPHLVVTTRTAVRHRWRHARRIGVHVVVVSLSRSPMKVVTNLVEDSGQEVKESRSGSISNISHQLASQRVLTC